MDMRNAEAYQFQRPPSLEGIRICTERLVPRTLLLAHRDRGSLCIRVSAHTDFLASGSPRSIGI